MAITISKAANEIISLLKKQQPSEEKKKTYWNLMTEQLSEEGTWDDDLLDQVREIIIEWVNKLKKSDLKMLWEESETAAENYASEEMPENEIVFEELSEELLDVTLNKIEDSIPREEYYIPEAKSKKSFSDDGDDFDDDFKDDDIFEDDDLDDIEDNYFDDDDRY